MALGLIQPKAERLIQPKAEVALEEAGVSSDRRAAGLMQPCVASAPALHRRCRTNTRLLGCNLWTTKAALQQTNATCKFELDGEDDGDGDGDADGYDDGDGDDDDGDDGDGDGDADGHDDGDGDDDDGDDGNVFFYLRAIYIDALYLITLLTGFTSVGADSADTFANGGLASDGADSAAMLSQKDSFDPCTLFPRPLNG